MLLFNQTDVNFDGGDGDLSIIVQNRYGLDHLSNSNYFFVGLIYDSRQLR